MPFFICPNCQQRSLDHDAREGLTERAPSCERCGFGFLWELMEDYYPAPATAMLVCDAKGRVLAAGRGVFELTGYQETDLIGRDVAEGLGLGGFPDDRDPVALALEWGVRRLGQRIDMRTRSGQTKAVTADFFPGYDDDGGLLVALAPAR